VYTSENIVKIVKLTGWPEAPAEGQSGAAKVPLRFLRLAFNSLVALEAVPHATLQLSKRHRL